MIFFNEMAYFVEVVKSKSFTKAAEVLAMPKSTLSGKITALEQHLQTKLLHRTTRKIELTEAGKFYYEQAARLVEDIAYTHQHLYDIQNKPRGKLRIASPVDLAYQWIAPILPEFCERYPNIEFEFELSARRVDLISEPIDIAIRVRKQPDSNLISRLLTTTPQYLYASPDYLRRYGEPKTPDELISHRKIKISLDENEQWHFRNQQQRQSVPINPAFLVNTAGMASHLVAAGAGISVLPAGLEQENLAQGKTQRILSDWQCDPIPIYAVTASRLMLAKTKYFIEFLKEKWGQER